MNDVTVTREHRVDAKASVHSLSSGICLCLAFYFDTRCTDSDRERPWHWLRIQSQPQELKDKVPLLMTCLQKAIKLHTVMKGIYFWRQFTHSEVDHWNQRAPELKLYLRIFISATDSKENSHPLSAMSRSSGTLHAPSSLRELLGFVNIHQAPQSALLSRKAFLLKILSKFMLTKEP